MQQYRRSEEMGSEVHEFTLTPALAMCPTDTPRTPHLDILRAKRLQFFSGTQSSHDVPSHAPSTSNPSEAPREGVSTPQAGLCDLPVSQSNGPVSQNDGPVSQSNRPASLDLLQDEAGLDLLLLQDTAVPEHRKLRHVLAWAQNYIRTDPVIGPREPWSREDHRTALKSDHVTSAKTAHVSPIYGDHETHTKGNRVTRTTIEESTRQPRLLPQPGLSVYETYLMCAARLSGGESEGHTEPQLPGRQEAGGLRQQQHHTSAPVSPGESAEQAEESRHDSGDSTTSDLSADCVTKEIHVAALSRPTRISSSGSSRRRRFWEKSSLLWSSYPEGALLPRLRSSRKRRPPSGPRPLRASPELHAGRGRCPDSVAVLPDELWMAILKLLPPGDLSCVAQTCHRLCGLANDRTLWEVVKIENSTCLNADWLSSIGRRGPRSLTLYRCTDAHVTQWGLEQLFAQSKGSLRELRITRCSGPGLHGDRLLLPCSLHCPRLTDVDVSWTGATDAGISALASATTSLRGVVLNGCCITDTAIKILIRKHGASLCRLEVFGCRNLSAACLSAMATSCPNLKVLNMGKLPRVTEACLTHISTRLKQLTSLNLTGLPEVRDRSVHLIARRCPELQSLTLRCCPNVTDRSLTEIGTYSATIRYLDVSGCSAVTDLGVQAIAMACRYLQYLDLSSTKISNKGVRLLASHCSTHLHTLKLSFCYICQDSLRKLCQRCKGLRLLHLYGACDFHSSQELRDINQYLETKCDLTCA
ncbi:hypothetical protein AGOR_G00046700 [Albula goreensis]|uniref:F-box domain-containing protein n=1 Tax=Albula goreensis TaxID=1534307 RepID=A0A8T3E0M8_9TELE|nr:hypothetical protein AGOR_G00046700 [Albula goreensis]